MWLSCKPMISKKYLTFFLDKNISLINIESYLVRDSDACQRKSIMLDSIAGDISNLVKKYSSGKKYSHRRPNYFHE